MAVSHADILRYWLGAIRHEEALALKIRAAPPDRAGATVAVDVARPGPGQTYFKLRCGGGEGAEDLLVGRVSSLALPLSGDRASFFEHWLRAHYRARRRQPGTRGEAQASMPMVLGFPVLYDGRRGELHALLQLPGASLRWRAADGDEWIAPARPRKTARLPPAGVELHAPTEAEEDDDGDSERRLPFALNELALSRKLGVSEERIEELGRRLATAERGVEPAAMIVAVLGLLDAEAVDERAEPAALVHALAAAAEQRITDPRLQVFPIGLAYDGASTYASHYLQLDLRALASGEIALPAGNPCVAYLDGRARAPGRRVMLGRRDRPLTPTQRDAGERFLGSRLTVVQGPPGTGKTELITGLCAHTAIERAAALDRDDADGPPGPTLVVTSTNNRAVDNALALLDGPPRGDGLPLALRVGSRAAVEEVTLPILARAQAWLMRATPSRDAWERAHARVSSAVAAVAAAEKPVRQAVDARATADAARAELAELEAELADALKVPAGVRIAPADLELARRALAKARASVRKESKKIQAAHVRVPAAMRALGRLRRHVEHKLAPALAAVSVVAALPELPAPDEDLAAWRDAVDDIGDALDEVENDLDEVAENAREQPDPDRLRARMVAVTAELSRAMARCEEPATARNALVRAVEDNEPGLFEAALELREQWAALHKQQLMGSLAAAMDALAAVPSPRILQRTQRRAYDDLLRLFPVWGCTLLSMGNNFSSQPGQIARVVIDEAGQCHPAHAVSALFRARQAMVIGDVHQLEPVIDLQPREEDRVIRRLSLGAQRAALEPYRVHDEARVSAQSLAARAVAEVPSLRDHFRCQPEIIAISNRLCDYELVVETPRASLADRSPLLRRPVLGVRVAGSQAAHLGSWRNDDEVAVALALSRALLDDGIDVEQLGVLTPYYGQMQALRDAFRAARLPVETGDAVDDGRRGGIALGTLHRFQGGARDVIVLSAVVSAPRSLAFTNGRANLINVGVSRARQHLVVIGDIDLLARGSVTAELVRAITDDAWLDPAELAPGSRRV